MKAHAYLNFPGNAAEAFEFYRSVLGGEFTSHVRFGDMPMEGVEIPEADQDKLMHVSLTLGGDDVLMGADALEGLGQSLVVGNNVYVSVHPDTKEDADRVFNGLSAGGAVEMPIADQVWGDYFGSCTDKFGVNWMVNHHPSDAA